MKPVARKSSKATPRAPRRVRLPPDSERPAVTGRGARDQRESAFAIILGSFIDRVPGARAAALVDSEGETVDYAGAVDPFEVRVAAAHWRIVLDHAAAQPSLLRLRTVAVRATRRSYLVSTLREGYALVAVLVRGAGLFACHRALWVCARTLGEEAGWSWDDADKPPLWVPLEVVADAHHRPRAVKHRGRARGLDVLGSLVSRPLLGALGAFEAARLRERAWRVRFETGVEAMLVREPGGFWYADEPPDWD
jgi:hypothetical protein